MNQTTVLGIDIGGSGMKAAPVDTTTGRLLHARHRIATPASGSPDEMLDVGRQLVDHFQWSGPVGITFPGVIRHGVITTSANLDPGWVGIDGRRAFSDAVGLPCQIVNDADAAGLAEVRFGAAADTQGVVLVLTFGTGIGSALFVDQRLVPNTELGHLSMGSTTAEELASSRIKKRENLSFDLWSERVVAYLTELERLLSPDLFVVGGGISKQFEDFSYLLTIDTPIVPAALRNDAGIVGAGLYFQ